MKNTTSFISTFVAGAEIANPRIVKPAADEYNVIQADGGADPLIGVTTEIPGVEGDAVDVQTGGIAEVECGGSFDFGAPLTSDAEGRAIEANPAPGENQHIVGWARSDGEEDAIGYVAVVPGVIHGESA